MPSSDAIVVRALVYADIFDYPLTYEELWYFLINEKPLSKVSFSQAVERLFRKKHTKYFTLPQREQIINIRKKRSSSNREKLIIAKRIAKILSYIPTIKLIGVSGAVAMQNAKEEEDIDLFFVTKKRQSWITRLLVIFLLRVTGMGRKRGEDDIRNKICANMFMSEESLLSPPEKRNIYIAHEMAQLIPLYEKENMYSEFLQSNSWIGNHLPNYKEVIKKKKKRICKFPRATVILNFLLGGLLYLCEDIAYVLQVAYMRPHITSETVKKNFLAFHPIDYEKKVMRLYEEKLKRYGLQ
ncbi:MAG: hypothetical protein HYT10_03075 [Candidatus Levybacteria bacterium]|nr:hypothetical protein [Candidatus Levybacteria bacterium]